MKPAIGDMTALADLVHLLHLPKTSLGRELTAILNNQSQRQIHQHPVMPIAAKPNVLWWSKAVAAHAAPSRRQPVRPITMHQPLTIEVPIIEQKPHTPLRRLIVRSKPPRHLSQGDNR